MLDVKKICFTLVLGQTQFMGLKFGIFRGFGWVHISILVDELGFRMVQSSVFLGFRHEIGPTAGSKFGPFGGV